MRTMSGRIILVLLTFDFLLLICHGQERFSSQPRIQPKPEAIAETRLLMEGLNLANFRGLERLLTARPASTDAWTFARGQALLIAETGNLLMLRQPRTDGRSVWLERAADLRASSTRLARAIAARDYDQSRALFIGLANTCNQCHQSFRVSARITPFAQSSEPVP